MPAKDDTLRDEQGNYAGQGTARRTCYMLHSDGCHFEALKAQGEVVPIDGWVVEELQVYSTMLAKCFFFFGGDAFCFRHRK